MLIVLLVVGAVVALSLLTRFLVRALPAYFRPDPTSPERDAPDPFEVLRLQVRLTALAEEIRRIEGDKTSLARAHHLRACQHAYDSLLEQACSLVGGSIASDVGSHAIDSMSLALFDDEMRMHHELELCSRGWSW